VKLFGDLQVTKVKGCGIEFSTRNGYPDQLLSAQQVRELVAWLSVETAKENSNLKLTCMCEGGCGRTFTIYYEPPWTVLIKSFHCQCGHVTVMV
jgi:hypothetical protein